MINKIILFTAITVLISCRKSNYQPPIIPVVPDSLYNWKTIATIKNTSPADICFITDTKGFIVAANQIYETNDGGNSWTAIAGTSASTGFVNLFFINSLTGWAQGQATLASTTDGGNSWIENPLPASSAFTIFFSSPSHGFYGDSAGLKMTTDAGKTWATVYTDPSGQTDYYPYFINPDTGYLATGLGKFAVSVNGGIHWEISNTMLPLNWSLGIYNQLLFLNTDTGFYACTYGVLKTTNGGIDWVNVLSEGNQGTNVIKFPDEQTGFYKGDQEIYTSTDGGDHWTLSCKLGSSYFIGMSFADVHHGWACTIDGRILSLDE